MIIPQPLQQVALDYNQVTFYTIIKSLLPYAIIKFIKSPKRVKPEVEVQKGVTVCRLLVYMIRAIGVSLLGFPWFWECSWVVGILHIVGCQTYGMI